MGHQRNVNWNLELGLPDGEPDMDPAAPAGQPPCRPSCSEHPGSSDAVAIVTTAYLGAIMGTDRASYLPPICAARSTSLRVTRI